MMPRSLALLCLFFFSCLLFSGCVQYVSKSSFSAPINKILEPVQESARIADKEPLTLPASVAVLMVPSEDYYGNVPGTTLRKAADSYNFV